MTRLLSEGHRAAGFPTYPVTDPRTQHPERYAMSPKKVTRSSRSWADKPALLVVYWATLLVAGTASIVGSLM